MTEKNKKRGFNLTIFLPDGDPEGLKMVEKSNWIGRGLVIPRALFGEARGREELGKTGVYILVGPSETTALPRVYIGEGDPVRPRLEQHAKLKDFWTHAIVFVSKDNNLNKAHVQWLESRLVGLAKENKRCVLDNGNTPAPPSLSESSVAEAEGFFDDLLVCLPVIGYPFFERSQFESEINEKLFIRAKGVEAIGYDSPAGFVVLKGSQAVKDEKLTPTVPGYAKELRANLSTQGVLLEDGGSYKFSQDYIFSSPSTASDVVLGRSSNGRTEWKTKDGRTLKEIQSTENNI